MDTMSEPTKLFEVDMVFSDESRVYAIIREKDEESVVERILGEIGPEAANVSMIQVTELIEPNDTFL